jgi:hypothetical protein
MSALLPKADITERKCHVRFVPKADILRCGKERRYSITSLARNKVASGIARPIFLAVFRFKISSNFVGCSIGKSEGLAPLANLPTYPAARANKPVTLAPRGITNFRQQLTWTEGLHRVSAVGELSFGRQRQDRLMYREKDSKSIRRSGCS